MVNELNYRSPFWFCASPLFAPRPGPDPPRQTRHPNRSLRGCEIDRRARGPARRWSIPHPRRKIKVFGPTNEFTVFDENLVNPLDQRFCLPAFAAAERAAGGLRGKLSTCLVVAGRPGLRLRATDPAWAESTAGTA